MTTDAPDLAVPVAGWRVPALALPTRPPAWPAPGEVAARAAAVGDEAVAGLDARRRGEPGAAERLHRVAAALCDVLVL